MSRIEEAAQRLEKAVSRLEAAMGRMSGNEILAAQLAEAKAERAALSDLTSTVAHRLDAAIGRLDQVLGS